MDAYHLKNLTLSGILLHQFKPFEYQFCINFEQQKSHKISPMHTAIRPRSNSLSSVFSSK